MDFKPEIFEEAARDLARKTEVFANLADEINERVEDAEPDAIWELSDAFSNAAWSQIDHPEVAILPAMLSCLFAGNGRIDEAEALLAFLFHRPNARVVMEWLDEQTDASETPIDLARRFMAECNEVEED